MSQSSLDKLSNFITEELKKDSEAFRLLVSDTKVHIVSLDVKNIKEQIIAELEHRSGRKLDLPESILKVIDEHVPRVVEKLYNQFNPDTFNSNRKLYVASERVGNSSSFTFKLAAKATPNNTRNVFAYFRRAKQKAQRNLVKALDNAVAKVNSGRSEGSQIARLRQRKEKLNKETGSMVQGPLRTVAFLDIGHVDEASVNFQRQAALNQGLYDLEKAGDISSEATAFIRTLAAEYNIGIYKEGDPRPGVIAESSVFLEGKGGNRSKQTDSELQKFLDKIVSRVTWENQSASDSPLKVVEKRILNDFSTIGKKDRRTKNSIKKQKVNNKNSKGKSNKQKAKATKARQFSPAHVAIGKKSGAGARAARGAQFSLPMLLGLLNKDLPKTVAKNMGAPALENRTGRFAGSVRAMDVTLTPQGFPSVGYTYQTQPYGVYEASSGSRFSDRERDPRRLIDASIREIAAQHIQTRLFTRRV